MAQATPPHTDLSYTPSVSLRHPSSPFARMVFTQHGPRLSLFSTQEHPPQDKVQAAQRGVRDSTQSVPPNQTPVSSPPGPTRTLAPVTGWILLSSVTAHTIVPSRAHPEGLACVVPLPACPPPPSSFLSLPAASQSPRPLSSNNRSLLNFLLTAPCHVHLYFGTT